jgi:hypothetical protein
MTEILQNINQQRLINESYQQELQTMANKRNYDIHIHNKDNNNNNNKIKRKATKTVHFADDHGYLLVKNFNIPTSCNHNASMHKQQPPVKKLSKVTNFTECIKENNDIYLESTLTNKSAVFGTLVIDNTQIEPNDIKIAFSWDNKQYRSALPYYLGSKTGRLLFKLPVPRRRSKTTDVENLQRTLQVNFFVLYQGKRLTKINNGDDFLVSWTGQ